MNIKNNFTQLEDYEYYDGECFITFIKQRLDIEQRNIEVIVIDRGKIILTIYDLFVDKNNDYYFEYGCVLNRIYLKNFN